MSSVLFVEVYMPATSKDVAREAGVSPSTVSRAFTRPEMVDPHTRELIFTTARRLNYRPNRAARLLSSGQTGYLGAVLPDVNNPFFASVLKGIYGAATGLELQVLFVDFCDDEKAEDEAVTELTPQVDAFILCSSRLSDSAIINLHSKQPVVLVNRQAENIPYVHFDNAEGMREAYMHLLALGHRRIGYCGGPALSRSAQERLNSFTEMAQTSKAASEGIYIGEFPSTFEGGAKAADTALNQGVSAVIAYNDVMAIGMMNRLISYGIELPADLSIIGFDDVPIAAMMSPELTSVRLPQEEAGRLAVELAVQELQTHDADSVDMPVSLQVRSSTSRFQPHR